MTARELSSKNEGFLQLGIILPDSRDMLFFVPTPIGNLQDMTLRGLEVLSQAEVLLVEDGRVTGKLFQKLEIKSKPRMVNLVRSGKFNEVQVYSVLEDLRAGRLETVALVSDAGSPGLSDPGFEVIRFAQEEGLDYTVLPGANALVPALVASGLVGGSFRFLGFLPVKKGRQTLLQSFRELTEPVVFYESVHRIRKTLRQLQDLLEPERKVFVARELTKQFEEYTLATLGELDPETLTEQGEFVVVLDKQAKKNNPEKSGLGESVGE